MLGATVCLFLQLAVFVRPSFGSGNRKLRDGRSLLAVPQLGITAEASDQHDFLHVCSFIEFPIIRKWRKVLPLTSDLLRELNNSLLSSVGPSRGRLVRRYCLNRSSDGWSQGLRDDWAHNSAAAGHQDESEILFPDSGHELVVLGAAQAHVCRVVSLINRSVATLTKLAWGHSSISSLTVRDMLQLDLLSSCWLPARPWLLRRAATAGMSGRVDAGRFHHLARQRRASFENLVDRCSLFDHLGDQMNRNSCPTKHGPRRP